MKDEIRFPLRLSPINVTRLLTMNLYCVLMGSMLQNSLILSMMSVSARLVSRGMAKCWSSMSSLMAAAGTGGGGCLFRALVAGDMGGTTTASPIGGNLTVFRGGGFGLSFTLTFYSQNIFNYTSDVLIC